MTSEPEDVERHAHAQARGRRLFCLANAILEELVTIGLVTHYDRLPQARVAIMHKCADDMFGNAAIDFPAGTGQP